MRKTPPLSWAVGSSCAVSAVALPGFGFVPELALPAFGGVSHVAIYALDVVRELGRIDERAVHLLALVGRVGVVQRIAIDTPFSAIDPNEEAVVTVYVVDDRGLRRCLAATFLVARPGLAADVARHHLGFGRDAAVGVHGEDGGRRDPFGAVDHGVDRQEVRVVRGQGEVAERHVVVVRHHVLRRARGHGVVHFGGDQV